MITRNWRDTSYEYVSAWHLFSIVWYFNLCKKVAFLQSCYKSEINPCQLVLITLNIEKIDIWYCGSNHNLNLWAALRKLSSVHNNRRLQYSAEACKWTDTQLFFSQICLIKSWKTFICEFTCPDCMWPLRERFHITFRYGMDRDFVLPQNEKTVNREESIIYSLEGKPVRNVECQGQIICKVIKNIYNESCSKLAGILWHLSYVQPHPKWQPLEVATWSTVCI